MPQSTAENLRVIYEDNHLLIVNKRASDLVQGDESGDEPLIEVVRKYIRDKYNKPGNVYVGGIHRLDRPVSGIVIFGKTSKATSRLSNMLREKKIKKTYWAVVADAPKNPEGRLEQWLMKNKDRNKSYVTQESKPGAKKAELTYRTIAQGDRYTLLEVSPITGRHHQIRVQLSKMGCIIKGDLKYGAPRSNKDASIHLHARKIEFEHPVRKEPLVVIAPTPDDALWRHFEDTVGKE